MVFLLQGLSKGKWGEISHKRISTPVLFIWSCCYRRRRARTFTSKEPGVLSSRFKFLFLSSYSQFPSVTGKPLLAGFCSTLFTLWLGWERQREQTRCDNRVLLFIQELSPLARWLARLMSLYSMSAEASSPRRCAYWCDSYLWPVSWEYSPAKVQEKCVCLLLGWSVVEVGMGITDVFRQDPEFRSYLLEPICQLSVVG